MLNSFTFSFFLDNAGSMIPGDLNNRVEGNRLGTFFPQQSRSPYRYKSMSFFAWQV